MTRKLAVRLGWCVGALSAAIACGDEDHTFEAMGGRARNPGDVDLTTAGPSGPSTPSTPSGGTGGTDTGAIPATGGRSTPVDVPVQIGGSPGFAGFPADAGTSGFGTGTPGFTGGTTGLGGSSFSGSGGGGNVPGGLLDDAGVGI